MSYLRDELRRVLPNSTWTAAGIGRYQTEVMDWALAKGVGRHPDGSGRQHSYHKRAPWASVRYARRGESDPWLSNLNEGAPKAR
jgi:hypothetical protein